MLQSAKMTRKDAITMLHIRDAELASARAEVASLTAKLAEIQNQLTWLNKQLFGKKSERRIIEPSNTHQR